MLDERKLKILYAIIEYYKLTAEPIGSKTISDKYDLGVSSATIRNDMSVLEDLGLIEKTHSSSGRIPSNRAYRYYVDSILENLSEDDYRIESLNHVLGDGLSQIEDILEKSIKVLSDITMHMAIALVASDSNAQIRRVNITKIDEYLVLAILVFGTNDIVHKTFALANDLDEKDLAKINNLLNEDTGLSLSEYIGQVQSYKEFLDEKSKYNDFFKSFSTILEEILDKRKKTEVLYEGISNIFNYPEYSDTDKIKGLVDFVEDSKALEELMTQDKDKELSINIGEENSIKNLDDITVITSNFGLSSNIGRIGIIGPTRMDYDSVIISILSISSSLKAAQE